MNKEQFRQQGIEIRKDFPLFNSADVVYLDNAATSQKPECVIQAERDFYEKSNANPLRGLYALAEKATKEYEDARKTVADFIGAADSSEIIFTRNATEGLNLAAYCLSQIMLKEDDEIVVSIMEHHSNLLPWQQAARRTGAVLKFIECSKDGVITDEAFENAINMQWSDAANTIKSVKDKEKDKKTKGYLYQIQAEYINKIDPALSQEVLKAGKKLNAAILSPIAGIQYQRTINTIPQAQAISTNLDAEKLGLNELLVYVDGILANLCMGSEYEKFEEALSQIGTILGFVCSRPDKETGGYGPDNLWAIDTGKYLVIECKTEATTQTIKKDYCNQLSGSVNWFKENYVYPNECVPIMIHPSKVVDEVASPDENMRVMTEKELTCFRKNLRDFYSTLCQNGNLSDVNKINELLRIYKLRKDDIVNRYTVKFERKD